MRRVCATTLLGALSVCMVAVPPATGAPEPFEINAIISVTGAAAFVGRAEVRALSVAETVVDKSGGIAGRPVKFAISDDQSNPQVAVQLATGLLAKGVPVIVGPDLVANCEALLPLVKGKAVEYCTSSGFHPEPHTFAYTQGVSTLDQLVFAVNYLRKTGARKIASLTSIDANGQDADRGIALALGRPENRDMSLVAAMHFSLSDLTVDAQMARIKASGAQAMINYNTGTPFGTVLHGYADLGMTIPLVTQPAALAFGVMRQYAQYLPKDLLITGLIGDAPQIAPRGPVRNAADAFVAACKAAGVDPDHPTALAWDPAMIVVAAFRKLGLDATGPQIDDFIANLHGWGGMNGEYDFRTSMSGLTPYSIVMVRWDAEKGAFVALTRPGGALVSTDR